MKYWYKLTDAQRWEEVTLTGGNIKVPLYEETPEIVKDFQKDPFSNWWPLRRQNSSTIRNEDAKFEFSSLEEAQIDLYTELNESLYCQIHDC